MKIKEKTNPKFLTKNSKGIINGFLVPIYNIHDNFFPKDQEPQQVYLTVISKNNMKGPHLHFVRTGCFTCIRGNCRFILKTPEGYKVFKSGDEYEFRTVMVPTGIPAVLQNLGDDDAYVLNMPYPAWTSDMNDEYDADFSDFDFNSDNHV